VLGPVNVFLVNAAVILASAFAVLILIPADPDREGQSSEGGFGGDFVDGLRFIYQEKVIFALLLAVFAINFLTTPLVVVILPVYVDAVHGSPTYLGALLSVFGAGTLIGTTIYAVVGHRVSRRGLWLGGQVLTPLLFVTLFLEPPFLILVIAMVLGGIVSGPLNPLMVTLRHERAPVHTAAGACVSCSACEA
jgi:MFS family permease